MNQITPMKENVYTPPNPASIQEKKKILTERTGWDINEDTPYLFSEESKVRLSYAGEFLRVFSNSDYEFESFLKKSSQKYAELRDEIITKYADDEDGRFKQLDELNQAFDKALENRSQIASYFPQIPKLEEYADRNEAEQAREANERHQKAMSEISDNLNANMQKHIDTFFESFIKKIETGDFETAFGESMSLLTDTETKSASEISYNDLLYMRDVINSRVPMYDADGNEVEYHYTLEEAFMAISADEKVPEALRNDLLKKIKEGAL